MAKLYWKVKIDGKWTWRVADFDPTTGKVHNGVCACGTRITANGQYWGVKKCAKCQRLEREQE